jgi:hypothetical protein
MKKKEKFDELKPFDEAIHNTNQILLTDLFNCKNTQLNSKNAEIFRKLIKQEPFYSFQTEKKFTREELRGSIKFSDYNFFEEHIKKKKDENNSSFILDKDSETLKDLEKKFDEKQISEKEYNEKKSKLIKTVKKKSNYEGFDLFDLRKDIEEFENKEKEGKDNTEESIDEKSTVENNNLEYIDEVIKEFEIIEEKEEKKEEKEEVEEEKFLSFEELEEMTFEPTKSELPIYLIKDKVRLEPFEFENMFKLNFCFNNAQWTKQSKLDIKMPFKVFISKLLKWIKVRLNDPKKTADDIIVKVTGISEYIIGDDNIPLYKFEHIYISAKQHKTIFLNVVEKDTMDCNKEKLSREGNELNLVYTMQQYKHEDLIEKIQNGEASLLSSWTVEKNPFRIKILSLLNHQLDENSKIKEVYVVVSVVIGSRIFMSHTFPSVELKRDTTWNSLTTFQKLTLPQLPLYTGITLFIKNSHFI